LYVTSRAEIVARGKNHHIQRQIWHKKGYKMNKLMDISVDGFLTWQFVKKAQRFMEELEKLNIHVDGPSEAPYWSHLYKGVTFKTKDDLKEFCLQCWCEKNTLRDHL